MIENNLNVEEMQERLALFVLDALSPEDAAAFAAQIANDVALQAEAVKFQSVAAQLAFATEEVSPSPKVRSQLLASIAEESTSTVLKNTVPYQTPQKTHHDVFAHEGEWLNMYPGVFCKTLFLEPSNGYVTTLMKLEPGARLPNHHHRGAEQCMVISGEIEMNDRHYKAGDFTVALAGSDHIDLISKTGGMVLLVSPPDYELLTR